MIRQRKDIVGNLGSENGTEILSKFFLEQVKIFPKIYFHFKTIHAEITWLYDAAIPLPTKRKSKKKRQKFWLQLFWQITKQLRSTTCRLMHAEWQNQVKEVHCMPTSRCDHSGTTVHQQIYGEEEMSKTCNILHGWQEILKLGKCQVNQQWCKNAATDQWCKSCNPLKLTFTITDPTLLSHKSLVRYEDRSLSAMVV